MCVYTRSFGQQPIAVPWTGYAASFVHMGCCSLCAERLPCGDERWSLSASDYRPPRWVEDYWCSVVVVCACVCVRVCVLVLVKVMFKASTHLITCTSDYQVANALSSLCCFCITDSACTIHFWIVVVWSRKYVAWPYAMWSPPLRNLKVLTDIKDLSVCWPVLGLLEMHLHYMFCTLLLPRQSFSNTYLVGIDLCDNLACYLAIVTVIMFRYSALCNSSYYW